MIVRVQQEDKFVGNFETALELPAVGDTFWYGRHGPYEVLDRTFIYSKDIGDSAHDVILNVQLISPHLSPS